MSGPISSTPGSQIPAFSSNPEDNPETQGETRSADANPTKGAGDSTSVQRKSELPPQKNLTVSHADGKNKQDTQSLKESPPRLPEPTIDVSDPAVNNTVGNALKKLDVKSFPEGIETAINNAKNPGKDGSHTSTKPNTTTTTKAADDAALAETDEATATGKAGSDLKTQTKGSALASQTFDIYKTAKEKFSKDPLGSFVFEAYSLDVRAQLSGLEDGSPELIKEIESDLKKLHAGIVSGEISDPEEATLQLMEMQSKLTNRRLKFSQETIEITRAENQKLHKERMGKIEENIEKLKKAEKSGLIGKIFGWLATIASAIITIATAVVTVLTFGAAAPALAGMIKATVSITLMAVATTLSLTVQISNETGGWMNDIFGEDGKTAASIFWTALITVMSIIGSFGVAGAATAVGESVKAGAAAVNTTTKAIRIAELTRKGAVVVNAVSMAASGGAGIATAVYNKDAAELRAEAKEIQAFILRNGQIIEETSEELKKLLDEMQEGIAAMTQIISASHDTKTQISKAIKA